MSEASTKSDSNASVDIEKSPSSSEKSNVDPYNPFDHRQLENPTSDAEALANLLNSALGTGILAMPLAFECGGLWLSLIGTLAVGIICTYCMHILVQCAHILCHRQHIPSMGYATLAESAFRSGPESLRGYAHCARTVINTFLVVSMTGCCCIYNIFIAKNLEQVIEIYTELRCDVRFYILCLLGPLIMINLLRNWKLLAPLSMFANIFMAVGLAITMYYIVTDLPSPSQRPAVATSWEKLPMFLGISVFALEGIGVVLSLENDMKHPTHFIRCPGLLHIGMCFVTLLYAVVGFCGYLKYGDKAEGSITLNLPIGEILAQSVKVIISMAVFLTHPLQLYVPIQIITDKVTTCFQLKNIGLVDYTTRIALVVLTVIIAIAIPDIGPFMTLIGAVCLSTLGLIFPAVIETVTYWNHTGMGQFYWRLWKNSLLIVFGVVAFLTGTYVGLKELHAIQ